MLFDGRGNCAVAQVETHLQLRVIQSYTVAQKTQLHIAVCLSRGDGFEFMLQKITELGASKIHLLLSDHCQWKLQDKQKLKKKIQRWQHILISACEQSGNNFIPSLESPQLLSEFIECYHYREQCLLVPEAKIWLHQHLMQNNDALNRVAIIGPEGGFSEEERQLATKANCIFLRLSSQVLKSHTAPIAYCAIAGALAQQ